MGGRNAAVVAPSCGENGTRQVAGQDSLQGDGEGADQELAHQGGAHERMRSRLG